jgi:hypothetical protein
MIIAASRPALGISRMDLGQKLPSLLLHFINDRINWQELGVPLVLHHPGELETLPAAPEQDSIFFLHRFNAFPDINSFLKAVNARLRPGGCFVGCVETTQQFRKRALAENPRRWRYYGRYLLWQLWVRLPGLQRWFYQPSAGRCRLMSKVEAVGRLYALGFQVEDTLECAGRTYFIARKNGLPQLEGEACCGVFIWLDRIGQHGKPIRVYKFRTMYPYSEYLLDYVFDHNGLQSGGKIKDDPRVTPLGRFMRKYWLDELPMLLNFFRGQLKLFGVRPISPGYFNHYPPDFQEYRKKFKPGLVPPVYAELPESIEDVAAIEQRYLRAYERSPWKTDWYYARRVLYNIIVKKVRSH